MNTLRSYSRGDESVLHRGAAEVIQRCLIKERAGRYQRASEVRAALEAVQGAVLQSRHPSEETRGPRTLGLRGMEHLSVKNGDVLLLVGTNKGAFFLRSSRDRSRWDVAGPYFHGQGIYAMAYDGRSDRHRLWVSANSVMWGAFLRSSDDFGRIWTNPLEASIRFPAESGASINNIWQICLGRSDEPEKLYCGVEPAALFESGDEGESWSMVRGLYDHPHRPHWMPANGGLILHTILPDPSNRDRNTWLCLPEVCTAPRMVGPRGSRATMEYACCSCQRNIQSSDSACIRLCSMNLGPSDCSCKTTGGYTVPITGVILGRISRVGCPRILVSRC